MFVLAAALRERRAPERVTETRGGSPDRKIVL